VVVLHNHTCSNNEPERFHTQKSLRPARQGFIRLRMLTAEATEIVNELVVAAYRGLRKNRIFTALLGHLAPQGGSSNWDR